jgi:hypothetical protein
MAKNLTVPVLVGGSQDALQRDYHIESTPATYLLGENGQVLFHKDGYTPGDEKTLESQIEAALNGVAPTPGSTQSASCPEPVAGAAPSVPQFFFNNLPRE